ncbi:MAG: T9SS type A sorting domain-containing protein, partial [Rhizobacter sp.]|nr:T9SS type A sorting domain-containing protein [Chlorobiales bacterium]
MATSASAQNVPDANFRAKLSSTYGITFDAAGNITNPATAAAITSLDVSSQSIASLAGIEAFTALQTLFCNNNVLTSLNVSADTSLIYLNCAANQLTSLNISANNDLQTLVCGSNALASLNVSANLSLTSLDCSANQLTGLDISNNTALTAINISNNPSLTSVLVWTLPFPPASVTTLNAANSPVVYSLPPNVPDANFRERLSTTYGITFDANNNITNLPVAAALTVMDVSSRSINSLAGIEAFTGLTSLDCSINQLTSLNVSANSLLTNLNCAANILTSLNVLENTALTQLNCQLNALTSLDISRDSLLTTINISNNPLLTSVLVWVLPFPPPSVTSFDATGTPATYALGTSSAEDISIAPREFALKQNYPNPFNPATTISYQLSTNSDVKLKIYDMLGREVATLIDAKQAAGNY